MTVKQFKNIIKDILKKKKLNKNEAEIYVYHDNIGYIEINLNDFVLERGDLIIRLY